MQRLGVLLFVLGVGSFILPFFNLEFRLMSLFGSAQPVVAGVMAIIGLALLVLSAARGKSVGGAGRS